MRTAIVVVVAVGLAGCQHEEPPAPTCAAVTAHVAEVMRQGRAEMGRVFPQDVTACEVRKLSVRQRRCLMAAGSLDTIASCHAAGSGSDLRLR